MIQLISLDRHYSIDARENFLQLVKKQHPSGSILLHTCNRIELYYGSGLINENVARHIFRVASGLESAFIGESFIISQIKEAYKKAIETYTIDSNLHKLFQHALKTGKRVRTETSITRGALSHSQAIFELLNKIEPDFEKKQITFIGINKLNETVMNFLKNHHIKPFILANRNFEKAQLLENKYQCYAEKLSNLQEIAMQSDIIITATSAPHSIIKKHHIPTNKRVLIFDAAVPNDVEQSVKSMPNVLYFDIETIEKSIDQNIEKRKMAIKAAERIIEEEIEKLLLAQKNIIGKKYQYA